MYAKLECIVGKVHGAWSALMAVRMFWTHAYLVLPLGSYAVVRQDEKEREKKPLGAQLSSAQLVGSDVTRHTYLVLENIHGVKKGI